MLLHRDAAVMHDAELPLSDAANALRRSHSTNLIPNRHRQLQRICAWCRRTSDGVHWLEDRWPGTGPVTHGICPTCAAGFDLE